jgi:hypothetical protein
MARPLTQHKLETLFFLSCIPAPGIFLVIPSPAVSSALDCPVDESSLHWQANPPTHRTNPQFSLHWSSTALLFLADEFLLVTPSFLTGHFFLTCLHRLQFTSNPLKVNLRLPTREHLVEQLSFPVVTQTAPVVAVTEVYLDVD